MHLARILLTAAAAVAIGCGEAPATLDASLGPPDARAGPLDAAASTDALSGPSDAGCAAPAHVAACDDTQCVVPAGCFVMGSPPDEPCRDPTEVQHEVTLTHDFLLDRTELSRADFRALVGYEAYGLLMDHPVVQVSWHEVAAYANARSDRDGLARCYTCAGARAAVTCTPDYLPITACPGYRHPTEAEWEYAYRAGGRGALYGGTITGTCAEDPRASAIAWYSPNALGALHAPGGREPNAWGLFDLAGNAWEWTFDAATTLTASAAVDPAPALSAPDAEAIMRGGDWQGGVTFVRAAVRVPFRASERLFSLSARLARTLPPDAPRPAPGGPDAGGPDGAVPVACSPNVLPAPIQVEDGPRVHVQLSFEGREQLLLVDTGSSLTNFYLPPDAPPVCPGIGLVTLGCERFPFYGRNVRAGQVVRGLPVLGALGTDWILSRPTVLDPVQQTVERYATADEVPDRGPRARLPYELQRELMLVEARLDGVSVRLLLDTGTPRTLWIGPAGAPGDTVLRLEGETGEIITVREGEASVELAGEPAFREPIWRTANGGSIGAYLRRLGVVGILGLASLGGRRVYFGAEPGAVLLGPRP